MIFKDTLFLSLTSSFGILGNSDIHTDINEYLKENNGTFSVNNYKSACL